jgi:SAM-dependent methyltransferase
MAQHDNLYRQAVYYDIALKRDVSCEIEFMRAVHRHYVGSELRSLLDIACGPGYHARAIARQGTRAIGLDLRPEMLRFAAHQASAEGVEVTWMQADMRDFQLEAPVDMAICMFDGMDALLLNEDIVQCFCSVAANLAPWGLFLLDYTHPRDSSLEKYGTFRYTGEQDDIAVEIVWATNNPQFDLVTGVADVEIEIRVNDHGQELVMRDSARERLCCPQEVRLLAEMSGAFEVVGWYGDFNLNQPLDNSSASQRMIVILQKPAERHSHV